MKALLLALIRFYQSSISPWFPARCRFRPTCSAYAYEAISKYGPWKGGYLAIRRLLRRVCRNAVVGGAYAEGEEMQISVTSKGAVVEENAVLRPGEMM